MGGLILFTFLGLYLWGCTRVTRWLLRLCPWPARWPQWTRQLLYLPLLALVFVLPVADELIARPTFNALCEKGAVLKIDAQRIRGRTVRVEITPDFYNQIIHVTTVPIRHAHFRYLDAITGEELASYDTYELEGGLVSRAIGIAGSPISISEPHCAPQDRGLLSRRYGFTEMMN